MDGRGGQGTVGGKARSLGARRSEVRRGRRSILDMHLQVRLGIQFSIPWIQKTRDFSQLVNTIGVSRCSHVTFIIIEVFRLLLFPFFALDDETNGKK